MNKEQRKEWNVMHKMLNNCITKPEEYEKTVDLINNLQGMIYSSRMADQLEVHSEDILLNGITEEILRWYPVPCSDTKNSIAWHLWHMARVEDITMNMLAAGGQQVLLSENWLERMRIRFADPGNGMDESDMYEFNAKIDIESLLEYRIAVGRRTRKIVKMLDPLQYKEKVQVQRVQRLFDENVLNDETKWLADYWSKKKVAGLFLMPTTRHNFLHMNKCLRIRTKLEKVKKG